MTGSHSQIPREAKSEQPTPVIHVVDDDESFQTAVARLLRAAGYEVRTYASADDFLQKRVDSAPGCILLDFRMPGLNGLDLQAALKREGEPLPIVFLSGEGDIPASVQAIKSGAVDFLTKPVQREVLFAAIENALARAAADRHNIEQLKRWRARHATLTERERLVFDGVIAGQMNKEIARTLGTSERTAKSDRAQVMDKMGARSLAELVHIAESLRAT